MKAQKTLPQATPNILAFIPDKLPKASEKIYFFISNILDLETKDIAQLYRYRWDIEVLFRFLKQELNFKLD